MPQFDLYDNPNAASREWAPFIVDLQHDMLRSLSTRIMAPLVKSKPHDEALMKRLNPILQVQGMAYFLSTAEMASVPAHELGTASPILKNIGTS